MAGPRTPPHLCWATALAGVAAYTLWVAWSRFRGGAFGFHDLSLLNDLFANAVFRGRPFWVTELEHQHLRTHFTPTLLLLAPAFFVVRSQFLLVFLGIGALFAALAVHLHALTQRLSAQGLGSPRQQGFALFGWALFLGLNPYVKTVALSAHFEVFFLLLATLVLHGLLARWRWPALLGLTLLAVGVRPDGAMFLGAQALALLALPEGTRPPRRALWRPALGVLALCAAHLLLVLTVIAPAIGASSETRYWSGYGQSWPEVAATAVTHPGRVAADVAEGAAKPFNRSFFFIQLLAPLAALVANLPGVFLYMADAADKQQLWYYNSAFLLPGLFVCASAGLVRLSALCQGMALRRPRSGRLLLVLPVGVAVLFGALQLRRWEKTVNLFPFRPTAPRDVAFTRAFERHVRACEGRTVVATDGRHVAFVPNGYERYLLEHLDRADVVLVPDPLLELDGTPSPHRGELLEQLRGSPLFREELPLAEPTVSVFVRRALGPCPRG